MSTIKNVFKAEIDDIVLLMGLAISIWEYKLQNSEVTPLLKDLLF